MMFHALVFSSLFAVVPVYAIDLDINDPASLQHASFVVSHGMMQYYSGNQSGQSPGYLPGEGQPDGYYWWEGSGVFGSLIDYWYYTGDTSYNDVVTQAMLWQSGPDRDYQPLNSSQTLGNDDIGFWAMSALKAAELNFPNPPQDQPQWIPLAQTVFANYLTRWDTSTCGGGLHWQVFLAASGYQYKNSVSNGAMFNIGARLGKYTGNQTYLDWAEKVYDWTTSVGLIDQNNVVQDGASAPQNCSQVTQHPWTYNQGLYLYGAACMYNVTQDDKWKQRTSDLLTALSSTFLRNGIITEIGCQDTNSCNNDEISFKSYLMIWLADVAKVANFTEPSITPILQANAQAAAAQCSGGDDGVTCGIDWSKNTWDGTKGIGQEMDALEAFNALLAKYKAGPLKNFGDGGTSIVDPNAGQSRQPGIDSLPPITVGDKAGASILTILLGSATIGGAAWMAYT